MLSGKEINAQTGNRSSFDMSDDNECEEVNRTSICNNDGNDEFVSGKISNEFNNRVRVLELN